MNKYSELTRQWKGLTISNKISIFALIAPLLTLPISLFLVLNQTSLQTKAKTNFELQNNMKKNNVPVITTQYLPIAGVGDEYFEKIEGYDIDPEDELTLQLQGLPVGIIAECEEQPIGNIGSGKGRMIYRYCNLRGVANEVGLYEIEAVLTDSSAAQVNRLFNLQVEERN